MQQKIVKIGCTSDYKWSTNEFFDKVYYCDDAEYETITKEQIDYLVEHGEMPEETEANNDLKTMTVSELKEIAKAEGVKGYSKMTKDELIDSLEVEESEKESNEDEEKDA